MHEPSQWQKIVAENPAHSMWYAQRFRMLEAEGRDILSEARFVDALLERKSHVLDAGCGPGRHIPYLVGCGHRVVGVDIDPYLIEVAKKERPGGTYVVGDLVDFDLPSLGIYEGFDVVFCVGNVITFLAPSTRRLALSRMSAHLASEGRMVVGFGAGRGYLYEDFFDDVAHVGLVKEALYSTWTMRPYSEDANFVVAVLRSCHT